MFWKNRVKQSKWNFWCLWRFGVFDDFYVRWFLWICCCLSECASSLKNQILELELGNFFWKIRKKKRYGNRLTAFKREYKLNPRQDEINSFDRGFICPEGTIDLRNIKEVRSGHATDMFHELIKQSEGKGRGIPKLGDLRCPQNVCFSIIFVDKTPPLNLVSEDFKIRTQWVEILTKLVDMVKDPLGKNIKSCCTKCVHIRGL